MIWVLYIITGLSNPSLQQIAIYSDELICKKASEELVNKNVRSICIPKENK
jgi:hypothetical protein